MKNGQKGFSLVELITVIGVAAILMSIASVQANQWLVKAAIESQATLMYGELMSARQTAMNMKCPRAVVVKQGSFQVYSSLVTTVTPVSSVNLKYSVLSGADDNGIIPAAGMKIGFNERGYTGNNASFCIEPSQDKAQLNNAAYDSIVVSGLRIRIGKRTAKGTDCVSDNIQLK